MSFLPLILGSIFVGRIKITSCLTCKKIGKLYPSLCKALDLFTNVTCLGSVQCGSLATCISVRHMDPMCPGNYGQYIYAGNIFGQCSKAWDNLVLLTFLFLLCFTFIPYGLHYICLLTSPPGCCSKTTTAACSVSRSSGRL